MASSSGSSLQQHFACGVEIHSKPADIADEIGIVGGVLHLARRSTARVGAYESDGVVEGRLCDTQVDGGLDQLRSRSVETGRSASCQTGNTSSSETATLSKNTVPLAVVRWPNDDQSSFTVRPAASRRHPRLHRAALVVQCAHGHPMARTARRSNRSAGRSAASPAPCSAAAYRFAARSGWWRAALRPCVAEPLAREHLGVVALLLRRRADLAQHAEQAEVILRIWPSEPSAALRMAKTSASVAYDTSAPPNARGIVMAAEPAGRPAVQFVPGQDALAVAPRSAFGEIGGQGMRHSDGFGVIRNAPRRRTGAL